MTKIFLIKGLSVVCTAQDGYRRAGFVLKKGKNILDGASITAEKFAMLNDDPRLTVSVIDENTDITNGDHPSGDINTANGAGKDSNSSPSNKPDDNGEKGENPPQDPPIDESALKLSQTALVAIAETDPLVYFNKDGSPHVTKWREVTGNDALTKELIIAAIELAKKPKE